MRPRSSSRPLAVSRALRGRPPITIDLEDLEKQRIIHGPDFLPILGERLSFFIAGPPGCGKSTTASDLMNLIPDIPKFLFSDVDQDRAFEGSFRSGNGRLNRVLMEESFLKALSPQALLNESKRIQIANKLREWRVYSEPLYNKVCAALSLPALKPIAKTKEPSSKRVRTAETETHVTFAPTASVLGQTLGTKDRVGAATPVPPILRQNFEDPASLDTDDELSDSQMSILREINGDCWVVFDDVDKIRDPTVSKLVSRLMDNIVANGRSHEREGESHIHIIVTNHSLNDYRLTKYSCENCDYWIIFPNKSMKQQVQRLLSKMGLEKEKIYNEDRVIIHKSVPLFIITPRYIRLLS